MPFEGISVSDSRVKADSNCLLQILALSRVSVHAANPRTIVVKCDGSVYDVDVDVDKN